MIKYSEFARKCSSNAVYPLSIAEGFQNGEIIPDDEENTRAVLFWHYAGFAYLSGDISREFLEKIYHNFYQEETERRFILITDNPEVTDFFSDKSEVGFNNRIEYRFGSEIEGACKCDYKIERINPENYDIIQGRIVPSFSWADKEQFLKNGFGYVVVDGNKVAAVAFSAAISSDEVDIGVETGEQYRHKGLARALAATMCREILAAGKKPVWAHAVTNEGSRHTALSAGFVEDRRNTVIFKN